MTNQIFAEHWPSPCSFSNVPFLVSTNPITLVFCMQIPWELGPFEGPSPGTMDHSRSPFVEWYWGLPSGEISRYVLRSFVYRASLNGATVFRALCSEEKNEHVCNELHFDTSLQFPLFVFFKEKRRRLWKKQFSFFSNTSDLQNFQICLCSWPNKDLTIVWYYFYCVCIIQTNDFCSFVLFVCWFPWIELLEKREISNILPQSDGQKPDGQHTAGCFSISGKALTGWTTWVPVTWVLCKCSIYNYLQVEIWKFWNLNATQSKHRTDKITIYIMTRESN